MITSFAPNNNWKQVLNSLGYILLPWRWLSWRSGSYSQKVSTKLKEILKTQTGEFFTFDSGRTALCEVLKAYNISSGDEVLLQAFTCTVVPNAIIYAGAKPIYLDIEVDSYNIDATKIENKITAKTKAIIIQHTFGFAANVPAIMQIAAKHNLIVIEDCAHSLGAEFNGQKLGTFANASIFSFGVDKVVSGVRGGAAYVKDPSAIQKLTELKLPTLPLGIIAKHLLHPPFFALGKVLYPIFIGKIWLYLCKKLGFTARVIEDSEKKAIKPIWFPAQMPNALAHLAYSQLQELEILNKHRQEIAKFYNQNLPAEFSKPSILTNSSPIYLRYPLESANRNEIHQKAKNEGIFLGDWYDTVIAPKDADLAAMNYQIGSCPIAEERSKTTFNLPTHRSINLQKAQRIIDLLK
ncbi:MAG: aminotransferase class I/II-fold pyridoxal phosphate-dependent enzyme [Patescibacteria group bacterium]